MKPETLASILTFLLPMIVLGGAAFLTWLAKLVAGYIDDHRKALALQTIATGAAAIVADIAQRVIPSLRDPTKPGAWDDAQKAILREDAIVVVKKLYPQAVALVRETLLDETALHALIGTFVEKGVVGLKGSTQAPTTTTKVSVQAAPDGAVSATAESSQDPGGGNDAGPSTPDDPAR